MKRVWMLTLMALSFTAAQAAAADRGTFGPDLLPESSEGFDDVTLYQEEAGTETESADLPMAEPIMVAPVPSRVTAPLCWSRPNCCDRLWAGYCCRQRGCCQNLWDDYCGSIQRHCGQMRCRQECLSCPSEPACCDAAPVCCEPMPVCQEPCCDSCSCFDGLFCRLRDCCGGLNLCSGCGSGCDSCDSAVDCCDGCDDYGCRWFGGGFLSHLRRQCCDSCCDAGMWYEEGEAYEYEAAPPVESAPVPAPPAEDQAAFRLPLPNLRLSRWIQL